MTTHLPQGGEFLLTDLRNTASYSPEDFSSEQKQIGETTADFVKNEILPDFDRLESQDFELVVKKMRSCGELGLFLVDIPEDYGGLELDKATGMLLIEKMAPAGSFSITYGGQTGIGSLPIVYYGTPEQKQRYLGKLASGEWIGAYALTEPDCGSDPLSSRSTAVLSADGRHYLLNGVKQFITNSAFADLFTVFAKIDGKHFSAFLVERGFAGFSIGAEEKKMGLKGSSTTQLVLENVMVPVENLLGEPGKGHKIAFNVLNIGRLKVAATTSGMAKGALAEAASYAGERKQFGQAIGNFGAIKEKLADMTATTFAAESVVYRVAGLLDKRIATLERSGPDYYERYQKAIEEYAGECAMAKVFGSEALDEVVDQAVQIHGGYGYISEYPVERYYRDSRIQRIFEGTNEINRILIPTLLLRRAETGGLDLWSSVAAADQQLKALSGAADSVPDRFAAEFDLLARQKTLLLALLGDVKGALTVQEVLLAIADMAIGIFALESVLLRAAKVWEKESANKRSLLEAVVKVATFERAGQFNLAAARCSAYGLPGEALAAQQQKLASLASYPGAGLLPAKQRLALAVTEAGRYLF
jgi:alkylation response protein AidB-like acyl-CoA dehydrogenase